MIKSYPVATGLPLFPDHPPLSHCVRCGVCKSLCPTYSEDAREGMSARGRVMLLNKFTAGEIGRSAVLEDRIFSCMLCGACDKLCPLGLSISEGIYEGRRALGRLSRKRRFIGYLTGILFARISLGYKILKIIETLGEILPVYRMPPLNILRRLDVKMSDKPLNTGQTVSRVPGARGRIALFSGCTVNFLYPDMGRALISSLNAMRYDVILPKGEACCGAPLMSAGLADEAAQLARRNISFFKKLKVEAVISLCPTCVHVISHQYRRMVGEGISAVDVSRFFSDRLPDFPAEQLSIMNYQPKVICHDPCHSLYCLDVKKEPRKILKSLGMRLLDSEGGCCGFGGSFRLFYSKMSEAILADRVRDYKEADMIVTSCPNCVLHLKSGMKGKQVKHIIEIIAEALQGDKNEKKRQKKHQT